jgi:hypothetical protein
MPVETDTTRQRRLKYEVIMNCLDAARGYAGSMAAQGAAVKA